MTVFDRILRVFRGQRLRMRACQAKVRAPARSQEPCPVKLRGRMWCTKVLPILLLVSSSIFPFSQAVANETDVRPKPVMLVGVSQGLLWARFSDVTLEDAIRAIGESALFEVRFHGELPATVDRSFNGEPVAEAVRWLLRRNAWVGSYDPSGRIDQLHVFGPPNGGMDDDARRSPGNIQSKSTPPQKQPEPASRHDRLKAIGELAREQPDGAVDAIASALFDDEDPVVRWNAAAALAEFPDNLFAGDLLAFTLIDGLEDPGVRRLAAWAIGQRRDRTSEWALRSAAFDPDQVVSQAAQAAFAAINSPPAGEQRQRSFAGPTGPTVQ